ncbi:MAG: hypothetical protein M3Q71_25795 [Chloroflexota bacterium]|nr:hypothetical protein [Chloroflexota bacterium]
MASVSHRPHLQSTPVPQIINRIYVIEAWLVDLALGSPGASVAGLEPSEVDRLARRHLSTIRAELRRREGIVEVGR